MNRLEPILILLKELGYNHNINYISIGTDYILYNNIKQNISGNFFYLKHTYLKPIVIYKNGQGIYYSIEEYYNKLNIDNRKYKIFKLKDLSYA